ncbi:hypothetical protein [Stenotrophomonas sp. MMGLT7]|uniref:hypothetical protein n=1 Tax=Stenotrophomonas sp. MMGLT7 TaxID=2901227 RepID=UPI001E467E9C|nr:hypothetical protein [Stenotrophomonas sp. MMGLT7]MCD7099981.1 hypothetical protein [Stenotrophomonas sp. MMGLT7]
MALWLAAACLALVLSSAPLQASTPASADCLQQFLEQLGWRFSRSSGADPQYHRGQPCTRASLAEAQDLGDLRLAIPDHYDEAQRRELLRELLEDPASICAYAFQLGDASRRAAARLEGNPGYRFSALQLGWIGFGPRGAAQQGWQRFRSFGRGYRPAAGNAAALDAFYVGHVRSECGVGRQVAQLATQRELYGDAGFDQEFSADELSIGTFLTLHGTASILLGSSAGEFLADGKAVRTSEMGRQAFMGAPGFIEHVFDRSYLDDINNQAENFVVVDVSEAAAQALAMHGGFAHYDRVNRRVWELARQMPGHARRRFERLLYERDPRLRAALPAQYRPLLEQIDALLADPFYQGFVVYVHPRGTRPVGYHIARLLDRNPRTPYAFELALHNLHTTLYRRWVEHRLQQCAGGDAGPSRAMQEPPLQR